MKACLLAGVLLGAGASAQPIFDPAPNWQSSDMQVSTGGALVDLNGDGWLDFVVANGNDISIQRVVVYSNTGAGTFQVSPGWQSADAAYHGHLDVADVNADGWPDVAVGVLLAQGGPAAKLYINNGGTLSPLPAWTSSISADSFGVAFGDMNGDGRPDLAIASGDPYNNRPFRNAVYLNEGGTLAATPSWQTGDARNYMNLCWVDADRDGRLDLCFAGANTDTFVYRNLGGMLEAMPSWRTNDDRHQFSLMAVDGDVTGDGLRDLLIPDNNQLFGASGRFRQYNGLGAGFYNTTANWTYFDGYTSAVTLGDLDHDGDLDLCAGEWFGYTRYFLNSGAGFGAAAAWSSGGTSTVEKLVLGDINNSSRRVRVADFTQPGRTLYFLPRQPVETVMRVEIDGVALTPDQYTFSRETAWVSVGVVPTASARIVYVASASLDMAVTNWDSNRPNQAYFNRRTPPCAADFDDDGFVTGDDFSGFVIAFETGDPTADFDIDGFLTGDDFNGFVAAFEAPC